MLETVIFKFLYQLAMFIVSLTVFTLTAPKQLNRHSIKKGKIKNSFDKLIKLKGKLKLLSDQILPLVTFPHRCPCRH